MTSIKSPIIFDNGDRLIVDTRKPNANMMNDAARPFAVCRYLRPGTVGRVTCIGRYESVKKARAALRYLKRDV